MTANWVNVFEPDPKLPSTRWQHILEIISNLLVFIASFIIFFDPEWAPMVVGLMVGANGVFGAGGNIGPLVTPRVEFEFKLDAIENNSAVVQNYVVTNQNVLSDLFNAYYHNGAAGNSSVVDLFKGGAWVGSLPQPDPNFAKDGSNRKLATYLENIVIAGLINTWIKQNTYILFVSVCTASPVCCLLTLERSPMEPYAMIRESPPRLCKQIAKKIISAQQLKVAGLAAAPWVTLSRAKE